LNEPTDAPRRRYKIHREQKYDQTEEFFHGLPPSIMFP
jgi:hypothetical protein